MGQTIIRVAKQGSKRRPRMRCYEDRKEFLSALGYTSYPEYLASDDWKKIRERKLYKHPTCLICPNDATHVHHMSYVVAVLLGLKNELLVSLCETCHSRIEFDGKRKRSLEEANRILKEKAFELGLHGWLRTVKRSLLLSQAPKETIINPGPFCVRCRDRLSQKSIKAGHNKCRWCYKN